jgi:hypothetical protein
MLGKGLCLVLVLAVTASLLAADHDSEWVAKRVAQIKPKEPLAATKVSWAPSLPEARRISEQEHRPLFLFSFEGNLGTGRC